jgi:hypothetical protein
MMTFQYFFLFAILSYFDLGYCSCGFQLSRIISKVKYTLDLFQMYFCKTKCPHATDLVKQDKTIPILNIIFVLQDLTW